MRMETIIKFSRGFFSCAKYVIYGFSEKGKRRTSNWVKRHGFPHHFFCTHDMWVWANHLGFCGSVSLSVYLECHHLPFVIHRDATEANSAMYVTALCKIESHWLLSVVYLPVHAKPCILQQEGGRGGDWGTQPLSRCCHALSLFPSKLCHQEITAFADRIIKKLIKVFNKPILIT